MLPEDSNIDDLKNHALPSKKEKVIKPLHGNVTSALSDESALNLIREKLNTIYREEPNAKKELAEDKAHHGRRSKHQQFMHELSSSGKSLSEIQTAWHDYYTELPDNEKHQVWQEFYANYNKTAPEPRVQHPKPRQYTPPAQKFETYQKREKRSSELIKQQLAARIKQRGERDKKTSHHLSSIKFGLLSGVFVLIVMMFGFFNERFLVPFIRPSHSISATPLILDENEKVGPEPKLIIPKINVEAPVIYDQESIAEDAVQNSLEDGVLHYATTPDPGEFGNAVIFGHSSNNIFNSGAYKYVFVQLNKLEKDDTFYIHKDGVRYVYKVYEKKIVTPSEVSVLNKTTKEATMTLITCDPPGTAINRLVVIGEQISPSIDKNSQSSVNVAANPEPEILPSNAPSLWSRFTNWLF
jgi:sortase A